MTHWISLPVVGPSMLAAIILLTARHRPTMERTLSLAGTAALVAVALGLAAATADGTIIVYRLGDWDAPFGIVLVGDRLSTSMVLLTALLSMAVLLYAIGSDWDRRGRHFHALYQFQLMGICGAFLTSDLFNLFVFFEVLLIASYGLMIHSGGAERLRAGTQYVVYNLLGSTLFLFALGTLYAVMGTLNMADLAARMADIPPEDAALLRVAGTLLLIVFAIKAALLPLHFWLPASYSNAPAPVAALFAIMTKVGAYAILRVYTLVFPPELAATGTLFQGWLMAAALLTIVIGMVGTLGATYLERLVAFSVIGSMGTLFVGIALFTEEAATASIYYIVHSTFTTAVLFLVADLVISRRGDAGGAIEAQPPVPRHGLIAALFFLGAIALTGMPPLSGFVGKLLILDAARVHESAWLVWTVILATSLVAILGFARAGSTLFWKAGAVEGEHEDEDDRDVKPPGALSFAAVGAIVALIVGLTAGAGPSLDAASRIAGQLFAPEPYISAVLSGGDA